MFPIICQIGPLTVYSYGLMFAIAVVVCTVLFQKDAQMAGIKKEMATDLVFWLVAGGILGARLFYILLNLPFFVSNPWEIIMLYHGGLAWQGGFIVGALSGVWFVKKHNLPVLKLLDLSAPYLALGQSIGRLGCFLNGCCYGKPAVWGIYFPVHHDHLQPTQLYDALGLFMTFLILKKLSRYAAYQGHIFVLYVILAAGLRFVVEFFRADHEIIFLGLSVYQWVCLVFLATAFYVHTKIKSYGRISKP